MKRIEEEQRRRERLEEERRQREEEALRLAEDEAKKADLEEAQRYVPACLYFYFQVRNMSYDVSLLWTGQIKAYKGVL